MSKKKIFPYILDRHIIKIGDNQLVINRTKEEDIIRLGLKSPSKKLFKDLLISDDFLKLIFFLHMNNIFSFDWNNLVSIEIPLMASKNPDFIENLKTNYKDKIDDIKEKSENMMDNFKDSNTNFFNTYGEIVFSDPLFIQTMKSRKKITSNMLELISKKNKDKIEEMAMDYTEAIENISTIINLAIPLEHVIDNYNYALSNYLQISKFISLNDDINLFSQSFERLVHHGIVELSFKSICLECYFRKLNVHPYSTETKYSGKLSLPVQCGKCNGTSFYYDIILGFPTHIFELIRNDIFQELLIGYILSSIKGIKKVYVHKKISAIIEGKQHSGVEIDVLGITDNDKVIIIEVTKSKKVEIVVPKFDDKLKYLAEKNIFYDKILYVTAYTNLDRFIPVEDDAIIFGSIHIPKIKDMIEYHVQKLLGEDNIQKPSTELDIEEMKSSIKEELDKEDESMPVSIDEKSDQIIASDSIFEENIVEFEEKDNPDDSDISQNESYDQFGRKLYDIICSKCGKPGKVPFKPYPGRSVFCKECYMKTKRY